MSAVGAVLFTFAALAFFVVLFIIGRELVCWYWKINESLATLKSIDDSLKRMAPPAAAAQPQLCAVGSEPTGV